MLLDVVYNHVGASGAQALEAFGPYFTDKYETFWGKAINFDDERRRRRARVGAPERRGLDPRLPRRRPAARRDPRDLRRRRRPHRAGAHRARARGSRRRALVIAESGLNDPKVVRSRERGGWGCDAVWADDFHHALRVLLTGDRDGYYAEFGEVAQLAKAFRRPHVHDGSYSTLARAAASARAPTTSRPSASSSSTRTTTRSATARSATGCPPRRARWPRCCTLLSPFTPMLFMGEEYGEARAVPVLLRPHRRGDRGRHARGPPARVRRLRRVRRRGGPRPAGPRDVPALEAHAHGRAGGAARALRAAARAPAARSAAARPAVDLRRARAAGCSVRRGEHLVLANFAPAPGARAGRAPARAAARHAPRHGRARPRRPARRSPERCCDDRDAVWPGQPFPLGATWDGSGTNFSLFSEHAERVELCLFDGDDEEQRVELTERTAHNWHCYLPGRRPGPALRLPRARPVRARSRATASTRQAADRPVREVDRRPGALGRGQRPALRARRTRRRRPRARRRGRRRRDPEVAS